MRDSAVKPDTPGYFDLNTQGNLVRHGRTYIRAKDIRIPPTDPMLPLYN